MAESINEHLHAELGDWLIAYGARDSDLAQWTGIAEHKLEAVWRQCYDHLHRAGCMRRLEELAILHVPISLTALVPFVCSARNGSGRWSLNHPRALFHYVDVAAAERHAPRETVGCQFWVPRDLVGDGIEAACKAHGQYIDRTDEQIARISISLRYVDRAHRIDLLSRLFAELLTYSRPLARYRASLYLTLDYRQSTAAADQEPESPLRRTVQRRTDPAAGVHDAIDARRGAQNIDDWVATDDLSTRWQLVAETRRIAGDASRAVTDPVVANVKRVRLVRQPRYGTALLAVDLEPASAASGVSDAAALDGDQWWFQLAFAGRAVFDQARSGQLSRWMRFTRDTELLQNSFVSQMPEHRIYLRDSADTAPGMAGKTAVSDGPVYRVLETLAATVLEPPGETSPGDELFARASLRRNSRLFVHVAYALAGPRVLGARLQRLAANAAFVDLPAGQGPVNDGYVYFAPVAKQSMSEWSFGEWAQDGTLCAFTDDCNAYLGSGDDFRDRISLVCVPVYERSLVCALSMCTILCQFKRRLQAAAEAVEHTGSDVVTSTGVGGEGDDLRSIKRDFEVFTGADWYADVPDQPDAHQIGKLQQSGLGLGQLAEEVTTELRRLGALSTAARDERAR